MKPSMNQFTSRDARETLPVLSVPDATPIPLDEPQSSLYGVGIADTKTGLIVVVPAYSAMKAGDDVAVYWGETPVLAVSTPVTYDNVDADLVMTVPHDLIVDETSQPFYRITRTSNVMSDSPQRYIDVRLLRPGGRDPVLLTPYNENLAAPQLPDDVVVNGVDAAQAALGVRVTILPYENMAQYDDIRLVWGSSQIHHTVLATEVYNPVVIVVDKDAILAAGDGDIEVMYQIIDVVGNISDGWSMSATVRVVASSAALDAPIVKDANAEGVLDLAALGDADAVVQVTAVDLPFQVGDTIALLWAGYAANGVSVPWTGSKKVTAVPQIVEFAVPNKTVVAIAQGFADVSYTLLKQTGAPLPSKHTQVRVSGQAALLPPPSVEEAVGGVLPADVPYATVVVQPYPGMTAGDAVQLVWSGTRADGSHTDYRTALPVSGNQANNPVMFTVPASEVSTLAYGSVDVSYRVVPSSGTEQDSEVLTLRVGTAVASLPPPTVEEAQGGTLAHDLPKATVDIPVYSGMAAGDTINLQWRGDATGLYSDYFPVNTATVGHVVKFSVPSADISPNHSIRVSYSVTRETFVVGTSAVASYTIVTSGTNAGKLVVMGARSVRSFLSSVPTCRSCLTALDADSLQPIVATWQYAGSTDSKAAQNFNDIEPARLLIVTTSDSQFVLNGANLCATYGSMVARLDDGSVVGWASTSVPGDIAETAAVVEISATASAYAARLSDGSVVGWGNASHGGTVPGGVLDLQDIVEVVGNDAAFAARRDDGSVVAWGDALSGASLTAQITDLCNVRKLVPAGAAFCALCLDGSVKAWGDTARGGAVPLKIAGYQNIVDVVGGGNAFVAIRADGSLAAWGNQTYGGLLSGEAALIRDAVSVVASARAFAVLRSDATVIAWGDKYSGGALPDDVAAIADIVAVTANDGAFAARRANGTVAVWGDGAWGGTSSVTQTGVVNITGGFQSFVALSSDGTMTSWGNQATFPVPPYPALRAVYGGVSCFAGLYGQGSVLTWGDSAQGGDSSAVSDLLDGYVSYEAVLASRRVGTHRARETQAHQRRTRPSLTDA